MLTVAVEHPALLSETPSTRVPVTVVTWGPPLPTKKPHVKVTSASASAPPSPSAPHIPALLTTPMPTEPWPQLGSDHSKCEGQPGQLDSSTQAECQAAATAAGVAYYSFRSDVNQCYVSESCNSPITATAGPWKIHTKPAGVWYYGRQHHHCPHHHTTTPSGQGNVVSCGLGAGGLLAVLVAA